MFEAVRGKQSERESEQKDLAASTIGRPAAIGQYCGKVLQSSLEEEIELVLLLEFLPNPRSNIKKYCTQTKIHSFR